MPECSTQTTMPDHSHSNINNIVNASSVPEQYREPIRSCNKRVMEKRERVRKAMARRRRVKREQYAAPHWGVIAEPFMSPWHALNLLMCHLHAPLITYEELSSAVNEVNTFLIKLTQPSQRTRQSAIRQGTHHTTNKIHHSYSDTNDSNTNKNRESNYLEEGLLHHSAFLTRRHAEEEQEQDSQEVNKECEYEEEEWHSRRKHNKSKLQQESEVEYRKTNNINSNNNSSSSNNINDTSDSIANHFSSFHSAIAYLSQSSVVKSQSQSVVHPPAHLMTDIQDALLLEVLKILCNNNDNSNSSDTRQERSALTFTRMGRREWKTRNCRLSPIDLIPHKKCFVVADRSDPLTFVIFLALPRPQEHEVQLNAFCDTSNVNVLRERLEEEEEEEELEQKEELQEYSLLPLSMSKTEKCKMNYNNNINNNNNNSLQIRENKVFRSTLSHQQVEHNRYKSNQHYVEILAVSNTPVPWRRLVRKRLPYISLRECAIAVIEKIDNNNNVTENNTDSSNNVNVKEKIVQNKECARNEKMSFELNVKQVEKSINGIFIGSNNNNDGKGKVNHESETSVDFFTSSPIFSASVEVRDDPLRLLPMVEISNCTQSRRNRRRNVRRSWVERLFLSNTSDRVAALNKLYRYNNMDIHDSANNDDTIISNDSYNDSSDNNDSEEGRVY